MLKIDIHTHIIPENLNDITSKFIDDRFLKIKIINKDSASLIKDGSEFRKISCNCWDHKIRVSECNTMDINIQILSTIPVLFSYWAKPNEGLKLSQFLNDHIYQVTCKNPDRFIGLGTIPMQDIDLSILEIDRCVNKLKFPGVIIGSNINGINLSDKQFYPIFEYLEKIGCSIFIHPWEMLGSKEIEKYWLPWLVGMPAETSRAICSIIFGGILDKFPKLKIAFAHGGGSIPFTIGRIDHGYNMRPDLCAIDNQKTPSSYLKSIYVDSLVHDRETLNFLIHKFGINQVALGSDYPFPLGEQNIGKLIESLSLSDCEKTRIFSGTALEWLGLDENRFNR